MSIIDRVLAIIFFLLLCVSLGGNLLQHWDNASLAKSEASIQVELTNTQTQLKNQVDQYNALLKQVKDANTQAKKDQEQITSLQEVIKINQNKANAEIAALKKQKTPKTELQILQFMVDHIKTVTQGY